MPSHLGHRHAPARRLIASSIKVIVISIDDPRGIKPRLLVHHGFHTPNDAPKNVASYAFGGDGSVGLIAQ
jgi:hypothetical protein